MQKPNFFLRTKLLPPRSVSDLLSRPRLTSKLQNNLNSPITLVTADAGYGKTTLVAEFVRQQPRQTVWYQLDHTDADPFVFLGYICHGIKKINSAFGETILPYLAEANDDLLKFPERAVDLLLNEILETLEQPFILVLDDYHHIGRETSVHKLVDRLLQYSSDMLHLIVTTRDLPPLAIVRRRSQGGALVITRDELLFTDDEMRDLFRATLNIELKPEDVAEYREKTHGWVTALQLVRQVAESQAHAGATIRQVDLREILQQSEKDIFDYFAEEVFAGETVETKQLLMHLSLLDAAPLDVCSQIFPNMRSSAILPGLIQRNVFLTVASDGNSSEEYRLHPLFKDFLARRLRAEIGRANVAAERTRIADFFERRGQWEKALSLLLEADNHDQAAQTIAARGAEWIAGGAITGLGTLAAKVPVEFLEKYPRALLNQAEVARLQGDTEKTVVLLHRAAKLLNQAADREGEAEALHSLATIARRRGDRAAAFGLLEAAENLAGETSEVLMKCENTRGLCFVQEGAWANAERQFRLALELAEKIGNQRYIRSITNNLALPSGLRGDFGEALRWLRRLLKTDDQTTKTDAQLPQDAISFYNAAQLHIYRGELTEAEPLLERALELCQLYNLKAQLAEVLEAYGNFYREKRDLAHATEFYERARKAYEDAGIDVSSRELDEERAKLCLRRGDAADSKRILEKLLATRIEKKASDNDLSRVRLYLCQAKLALNESTGVVKELSEIAKYFHTHNYFCYEAGAEIYLAAAHFAENNRQETVPHVKRAIDLAARFDYDYWLRGAVKQNPKLFGDETITELLPIELRHEAAENSAKWIAVNGELESKQSTISDNQLSSSQNSDLPLATHHSSLTVIEAPVDLTLKLLGHAEIFRDPAKNFAPDAWTTRRARDIFCCIATSRHRRIEKDVLIETFWGESDFAAIEKNFHPTISHIRKALNSRQTLKQNFLIYRDGAYQLNAELSYSIDTEDFERLVGEAETAKRDGDEARFRDSLNAAQKLYRGEFMAGVYDDWAEERRGYFKEQYERILKALSKIAVKEKNWSQATKLANEILRDDPYQEDIHRLLMRVYAAQGKRSQIKEQFETLRALLKKELGVEPAPETRRVFQESLNN